MRLMSVIPAPVLYDPRWPALFDAERVRLEDVLRDRLVGGIHHVGSTAVPGMPAKPVIDMVAGVRDLSDADPAEAALARLGYERAIHRVDAVLFNKAVGGVHTHHLHLTVPGSELWRERLAFRDALRTDPALVAEYAELKHRLVAEAGGGPYSAAGKRDFVRRVLADAGVELVDGLYADRDTDSGPPVSR
jgi:GrpB-like predicted nucleotidyltransferase (UPF0157 family)